MKRLNIFWLCMALIMPPSWAKAAASSGQATRNNNRPLDTAFAVVERGANYRVWQRSTYQAKPDGTFFPQIHKYTEVASGLCHKDETTGQLIDSSEEIDILPDGSASATHGQHKVYFPADIYNGVLEIVTPDGKTLQERPVGISYDDGNQTVFIGELKHSAGLLVGSNQVVYPDAFTGVKADLVCTYRLGGFECDLVFREQPPEPDTFKLNTPSSALQLVTEFFNTPEPIQQTGNAGGGWDTTLHFGSLTMAHGKAFAVGSSGNTNQELSNLSVFKNWIHLQDRTFLIEQLPLRTIQAGLRALPAPSTDSSGMIKKDSSLHLVSNKRLLPKPHLFAASTNSIKLASNADLKKPGFVLDYNGIVANQTDFTFQSDTTYYVSGEYNLLGTTTIEGGTVVKYGGTGQIDIDINGAVVCNTGPCLVGIFTSYKDNSVGESIAAGPPAYGNFSGYFLKINTTNVVIHDLRFNYGKVGIYHNWPTQPAQIDVWNSQFLNVDRAIYGYNVGLHNILISKSGLGSHDTIYSAGSSIVGENITSDSGRNFVQCDGLNPIIALTNCLITRETLTTNHQAGLIYHTNSNVYLLSPTTPIYKVVGGASYYLTNNSPYRGAGTTNINPIVLAFLAGKTTYPPVVYSNAVFTTAAIFSPQAERDNAGNPDIGYHYDPIDFLVGGSDLYANWTLTAGTTFAWYDDMGLQTDSDQPYGLSLNDGVNFTMTGTATSPCWITRYNMVQEGAMATNGWMGGIMIHGSGAAPLPQLNLKFTKLSTINSIGNLVRDDWRDGVCGFTDCEIYTGLGSYWPSYYFTNCLFVRSSVTFNSTMAASSFTFQNCTFWQGQLTCARFAGQGLSHWTILNTTFDGTGFAFYDNLSGNTNYTYFDYNAFLSGYALLEDVGSHDITNNVNYNWQASWLGNFYLPANSPLINAGNMTADLLGMYEFTTQTNQVEETNSLVDIGYHYVATDAYGDPLGTLWSGLPDYLVDTNGNGAGYAALQAWKMYYFGTLNVYPNAYPENDGFSNLQKYQQGLNPTVDYSATLGSRLNYIYDAGGWLNTVSGINSGSVSTDSEGNIQTVSQ